MGVLDVSCAEVGVMVLQAVVVQAVLGWSHFCNQIDVYAPVSSSIGELSK